MLLTTLLLYIFSTSIFFAPEKGEKIIKIQEIPFFEDQKKAYSYEEVSNPDFNGFIRNSEFLPINHNASSAYWVNFKVEVPAESDYLLEFFDQTIDSIEVHMTLPDGSHEKIFMGDSYFFNAKPINHKNFEIPLNQQGTYQFYIRFASYQYVDIRMSIRKLNYFIFYALNEYFIYGIFYGMILIISVYNLMIFSAIKERKYIFYTFYIISVGIYAMSVDGIAFQYLWPNNPEWNQIAYGVALFSVIFWSIMFSKRFLNLKIKAPVFNKLLNWVLALRILFFIYSFFWDQQMFQHRSIELIPLSLIFVASIVTLIRGYKPARFFVVAYGFLFFGFFLKAMLMLSVTPITSYSYYVLHMCFVLEMLFLTFALSDRVRIIKATRDRALQRIIFQHEENMQLKEKVNRELQQKIKIRTHEIEVKNEILKSTNERLIEQSHEVNQINSLLDLENWKLKNSIKSIQQERAMNIKLSYTEFKEIFPDSLTCLRYLTEFKWGNGFECIKCSNKKYSKGSTNFSNRCTKCGYNETPTSNTIFHKVRFPLEKAFYILYVVYSDDKISIDHLASRLDLNRNTVWNFRKKVNNYLHTDGSHSIFLFSKLRLIQKTSQA